MQENQSKQQSLGAEKCLETATRSTRPPAEALEFVQISLFPTCSGALVAAPFRLLAAFGDARRNSSPPGYLSGAIVAPLVAALVLLVAGLILLLTGASGCWSGASSCF